MVSATSTPIKPGDPIWVTVPGEDQAEPGVLVILEPGKNGARVQMLKDAAGAHSLVEVGRISYRRASDEQALAPPPPKPIAETSMDPFDQLVALIPKVIKSLESDVQAARERRDGKANDLKAERQRYGELKKRRKHQLGRLETALRVLTKTTHHKSGSNASGWTPKLRKAAGDRMRKQNADRAAKRAREKATT